MKPEDPSLPFNCKMVIVVLIIIVVFEIEKTEGYQHIYNESQGSSFGVKEREESDEMLIPVGMFDFLPKLLFSGQFLLASKRSISRDFSLKKLRIIYS